MRTSKEIYEGDVDIWQKQWGWLLNGCTWENPSRWPLSTFPALWASGCECPSFTTEHTLLASNCLKYKLCVVCGILATVSKTSITTVCIQWVAHGWTSLNDSEGMNACLRWKMLLCDIFSCLGAKEKEPSAFQTLWSSEQSQVGTPTNMLYALNVNLSWIFVISLTFAEYM